MEGEHWLKVVCSLSAVCTLACLHTDPENQCQGRDKEFSCFSHHACAAVAVVSEVAVVVAVAKMAAVAGRAYIAASMYLFPAHVLFLHAVGHWAK